MNDNFSINNHSDMYLCIRGFDLLPYKYYLAHDYNTHAIVIIIFKYSWLQKYIVYFTM